METYNVKKIHDDMYKGSYRTYEEWKRRKFDIEYWVNEGSYRTYEEWKPF